MSESWPTEAIATKAVEAAAKALHGLGRQHAADVLPPAAAASLPTWEEEGPVNKNLWRQQALPIVWPALQAIPDPRHTSWLEGYIAADNGADADLNPYPSTS